MIHIFCQVVSLKSHSFWSPLPTEAEVCSIAQRFNDRYLYLVRDAKSFSDAEQYCNLIGGSLASVRSHEENEFISAYIAGSG